MLHTYSIGKCYLESGWAIHPLSGSLLKLNCKDIVSFQSNELPQIVISALEKIQDPYKLKPPSTKNIVIEKKNLIAIKNYFLFFSKIKKINFQLSLLASGLFSRRKIDTSRNIFEAINSFDTNMKFNTCLVKCLTVAKCSNSFKKNGVIFIGAHLPLKDMHAWIIEGNHQPDDEDRQWINYVPLMAITYQKP